MKSKVFPRNLTARAAYAVPGNPANTRLESSVANCFPGLEFDARSLDRRFFPGLFFDYIPEVWSPEPQSRSNPQGGRLAWVDYLKDPMLPETSDETWVKELRVAYGGTVGSQLASGQWFIHWVEQNGRRITMYDDVGTPLPGETVWRLVRGLELEGSITICLICRAGDPGSPQPGLITLKGKRRNYLTEGGVFDESYQPGEFTDSMCNPWTHDFRDCGCHYWAANHPDIVLGPESFGTGLPAEGSSAGPVRAQTFLDWLREVRGPSGNAPAEATIGQNRPFQLDHYQINLRWQELPFVVEGREIGAVYKPSPTEELAQPYPNAYAMIEALEQRLAPMEHTLALQYLYALYSVRSPKHVPPRLGHDLREVREFLMLIAAAKMVHLRWANQLLWELYRRNCYPEGKTYKPILGIVEDLSIHHGEKPSLRRLDHQTLDDFIEIERPGRPIDTAYAQCVATLKQGDFGNLVELAVRIDSDGIDQCEKFLEIKKALSSYDNPETYLRDIRLGTADEAKPALDKYCYLLTCLKAAYEREALQEYTTAQIHIQDARQAMLQLDDEADSLADRGIGVPFFQVHNHSQY